MLDSNCLIIFETVRPTSENAKFITARRIVNQFKNLFYERKLVH